MNNRGRPSDIGFAEKHEIRRYREAGISIARLSAMWHKSPRRIHEILAEMRKRLGPEQMPSHKRHLVRLSSRRSHDAEVTST